MQDKDTQQSAICEKETNAENDNEALALIEAILDKDNTENIFLYDESGQKIEFEQIAVIPLEEKICVILKPVISSPGIEDNEALVFVIDEIDNVPLLYIAEDNDLIDEVFEKYYEMLSKANEDIF